MLLMWLAFVIHFATTSEDSPYNTIGCILIKKVTLESLYCINMMLQTNGEPYFLRDSEIQFNCKLINKI